MTDEQAQRPPYPGLRAFRREETDLFFGREDCTNAMVDRLAATRFLAVLGSSGTGKSSLVRTGLLDALELGLMAKAGSRWKIVDFRPGGSPLKNLARRLLETEHDEDNPYIEPKDVDLLRAFLARGPRAVIEWCRSGHLAKDGNLLLLVDQFEELFRYQDYAGREEAEAFVALLIESAREADARIYVTITMRSEYLGACALIEGLSDAINAGMFLTPRMTREHCRDAIVGPAEVCNIEIEPALVNRLLNDLANFAPWDDHDAERPARPADAAGGPAAAPAIHAEPDVAAGARTLARNARQAHRRRLRRHRRPERRAQRACEPDLRRSRQAACAGRRVGVPRADGGLDARRRGAPADPPRRPDLGLRRRRGRRARRGRRLPGSRRQLSCCPSSIRTIRSSRSTPTSTSATRA